MRKSKRIAKDNRVLEEFIRVYCRENHRPAKADKAERSLHSDTGFCPECAELLDYAVQRNEKCPLDPKPRCKNCPVHCYKPEMREKIRQVMKFSGMYFMKKGRLDWIYKYFL